MSRVIFSIRYQVFPERRQEYLDVVRELKNIIKTEGLESYSVFEQKNKPNNFEEIYLFKNEEAFENFDENQDERIDILMTKLSDMIKEQTTQYTTSLEVNN
ncbi:MAG: antibiotic biosynthesis monooxygenase [Melioribacter sp.]|jgi:quinol monooxygenase YgiN|nr:antibiotic biosynthesis monooxygenase [Melioribacter sp.]